MFTACIDHSMTNISFVCALRSIKRKEKKKKKKKSTIVSFTQREIVTRYYYHTAQGGFGFDTMSWEVIETKQRVQVCTNSDKKQNNS
jgi:hypothetical protein